MRKRIHFAVSIPVFVILYSYTAVTVLMILIFTPIRFRSGVNALLFVWANAVFMLMGKKLHIEGRQHMIKKKKYILIANHTSIFDMMAIMSFNPGVCWFGQEKLLKVPLFGTMLKSLDYIPMRMANIRNTKHMMEQLVEKSRDKTVAIFPEGTRTKDGKLNPFYRGFIYLLRASETDILPVTLNGFFSLKPKHRFSINFKSKLEVIIHEPISSQTLLPLEDKMIIEKVRTVIESSLVEI
jgi:1-acyl-sn-glycerol-3-phosphate acyltransferase